MATVKSKKPTTKLKAGKKKSLNKWIIVGGVAAVAIIGAVIVRFSSAATCRAVTFRQGSTGACVKDIQGIVNYQLGISQTSKALPVNGVYDAKTRDYVKLTQAKVQLTPDGIVGPKTWEKYCYRTKGAGGSDGLSGNSIQYAYELYLKHAGCN